MHGEERPHLLLVLGLELEQINVCQVRVVARVYLHLANYATNGLLVLELHGEDRVFEVAIEGYVLDAVVLKLHSKDLACARLYPPWHPSLLTQHATFMLTVLQTRMPQLTDQGRSGQFLLPFRCGCHGHAPAGPRR